LCKTEEHGEDMHRDGLAQAADITLGGIVHTIRFTSVLDNYRSPLA
jgi:hypothetical protein